MTNNSSQNFIMRRHLIVTILIAILILILLALTAGVDWFYEEPLRDILPDPVIVEPALKSTEMPVQ